MAIQVQERRRLPNQRLIRRLRQQRLLHSDSRWANGGSRWHTNSLSKPRKGRSLQELGWTREQAAATYYKLRSFEEDWSAPGMEDYDEM